MYAKIKTKSNFRNLNGQWLHVKEIAGKRVSCEVVINGNSRTIDFQLSEVTENNHCQIALAYATHYQTLKHYMTAKKYESLTVGQMANYLCKAKAEGVIIEMEGIVYKNIQKI